VFSDDRARSDHSVKVVGTGGYTGQYDVFAKSRAAFCFVRIRYHDAPANTGRRAFATFQGVPACGGTFGKPLPQT
jgi:hypothetical protein